jgi:hypothetical protein
MNYAILLSVLISFVVGGLVGQNKAEQESIAMAMMIIALVTMIFESSKMRQKAGILVLKLADSKVALAAFVAASVLFVGLMYVRSIGLYGELIGTDVWSAAATVSGAVASITFVIISYAAYQLYRMVKRVNDFNDLIATITVDNHVKS